jgi:carbon monoxide dehydrogenase subunit G
MGRSSRKIGAMKIENTFTLPLRPAEAWPLLMDVSAMAECIPGARITGHPGTNDYLGEMTIRLGPIQVHFKGRLSLSGIQPDLHCATATASANETKGRGGAASSTRFWIEPSESQSVVHAETDLELSGMIAQYGRGVGIINATAEELISQFVSNLSVSIAQRAGPKPAPDDAAVRAPIAAKPMSRSRLASRILRRWFAGASRKANAK